MVFWDMDVKGLVAKYLNRRKKGRIWGLYESIPTCLVYVSEKGT